MIPQQQIPRLHRRQYKVRGRKTNHQNAKRLRKHKYKGLGPEFEHKREKSPTPGGPVGVVT